MATTWQLSSTTAFTKAWFFGAGVVTGASTAERVVMLGTLARLLVLSFTNSALRPGA